ncbi:Nck-associated protein 5 [Elysia marginata]|uniref:Nck-associated protein 5 n=1 Tax=Elysia marginata TaxID=1093978 RepID=A0AAV4J8L9_9GAST|nr:Nck-associated protein 5 [Elysia marginata]
MEEMVANMLQYKAKIDQLKQENASMKTSYESNLQKYCSHISSLERDNMLLRNQVKSMETQIHGKGDDRDKSKLLLERLKMVEAENSSLVLENEQQRQQYEKCLDQIANQVVQALLAQKTLREECLKLQTRVQDLELQNKQLNVMFQNRLRAPTTESGAITAVEKGPGLVSDVGNMSLEFLNTAGSLQSMCSEMIGDDSPGKAQLSSPPPWLKGKNAADVDGAASTSTNSSPSSPSSTSSSSSSPSSTPSVPIPIASLSQGRQARSKEKDIKGKGKGGSSADVRIETEFPAAGNTSPKVKRVAVFGQRRARSLERNATNRITSNWYSASPSAIVAAMAGGKGPKGGNRSRRGSESNEKSCFPPSRLKQSTSADAISHFGVAKKMTPSQSQILSQVAKWKNLSSSQDRLEPQSLLRSLSKDEGPAVFLAGKDFDHQSFEAFNKNFEKLLAKNSADDSEDPIWVSGKSNQHGEYSPSPASQNTSVVPLSKSSSTLVSSSVTSQLSTKPSTSTQHVKRQQEQASKIPAPSKPKENQKPSKSTNLSTENSISPLAAKSASSSSFTKASTSSTTSASSAAQAPTHLRQQQHKPEQRKIPGPSETFLNESSKQQIKKQSTKSHYAAPLRDPFASHTDPSRKLSASSSSHPYYYYYDYSDEDSDSRSRPISRDFSSASTMSLNEILDSSMEGEVALDDDFFSDWSSIRLTPGKRSGDHLTGAAISNKAIEAGSKTRGESSSSSGRSRSTSSSPEMSLPGALKNANAAARNLAATSVLALREARLKQAVLAATKSNNGIPMTRAQVPITSLSHAFSTMGQNVSLHSSTASQYLPRTDQDTVQSPLVSRTVSQQARTRALESSLSPKFPHSNVITTKVIADVHSEAIPSDSSKHFNLPSASPSPNFSQRSYDQGYSSKESHSQSSPSPSPSISHRGTITPPWLHSTKDPHSFTRNELLSLVINREALGPGQKASIPSASTSGRASPNGSPKLRPGQLILAPEDKNFSFSHGFSSASSGSSDDKSPTKIFASSRPDMESSVIEVRQDGSHVYPSGLPLGTNSSTASSMTTSSCSSSVASSAPSSPIKSPSGLKVPPPVPKKPTRAVKPEARVAPSNTKFSGANNSSGNDNNNDATPSRNAAKDAARGNGSSRSDQKKAGSSTDITVGFLLQDRVFPPTLASKTDVVEDFLMQALKGSSPNKQNSHGMTNLRSKQQTSLQTPGGSASSSPYQTKCQSSDSSFENLRVERSGSKDDGYSTMSSDIHPEILDRFADDIPSSSTITGTTSCEAVDVFHEDDITTDDSSTGDGTLVLVKNSNASKSLSPSKQLDKHEDSCVVRAKVPQNVNCPNPSKGDMERTLQSRQKETKNDSIEHKIVSGGNTKAVPEGRMIASDGVKSFDVTSDADSALETSAHSTDTTMTVADTVSGSSPPSKFQISAAKSNTNVDRPSPKSSGGKIGVSKLTKIFDTKTKSASTSAPNNKCNVKTPPKRTSMRGEGKLLKCTSANQNATKTTSSVPEQASASKAGQTSSTALPPSSKQHDSPKRLANQFLKKAATGVTKTCKRITSPSSTISATNRPPIQQAKEQQKPTQPPSVSPKSKIVADESKISCSSKKLSKSGSPNTIPGGRLRFGFSNSPKTECGKTKTGLPKKATTSPPQNSTKHEARPDVISVNKAKRGLKFLSSSVQRSVNPKEDVSVGDTSSKFVKDPAHVESGDKVIRNVKATKSLRPLSADYATSISNINEVPHVTGDSGIARRKTYEKQRPFSICSDRDVVKNGPLRIIMTNQAFQQHSSSESDSDSEAKFETFPFARPTNALGYTPSGIHLPGSVANNSCDIVSDKPEIDVSENGTHAISSQVTTNSKSYPINTSTCTSTSVLPSSVSSMQQCKQLQRDALAATSSIETSQQVDNQPSNSSNAFPCQMHTTSTSPIVHTGDTLDTSSTRRSVLLRKSKSEHSLSMKPASTSAFDAFFGSVWDSGKMLERSASVSELDLLSKRSGSLSDIEGLSDSYEGWDQPSSTEFVADMMASSWPPTQHRPASGSSCDSAQPLSVGQGPAHTNHVQQSIITTCGSTRNGNAQFFFQRYHFYKSHHHNHHQFQRRQGSRSFHHPHPLHLQPLRLDLSDVTELDEEGSERGDTGSSFRGSLDMSGRLTDEEGSSKLTSDESPRLEVNGQTTCFNSQFYSLCKVDSNRSLQSSVNNSRERLSLTSLNESCEKDEAAIQIECVNKKNCKSPDEEGAKCCSHHRNDDNDIAAKEFDEISRQIANLSKTVDEINNSLSSLTSGEFESDASCTGLKRPFCLNQELLLDSATTASLASSLPKLTRERNDIIDGYHWVNDEFLLISGSGQIIAGGRRHSNGEQDEDGHSSNNIQDFAQDCSSSSETNDTEDAREEFLHISTVSAISSPDLSTCNRPPSGNWTLSRPFDGGQDDIFARSNFDTVRENIAVADRVQRSNRIENPTQIDKKNKIDLQRAENEDKLPGDGAPETGTSVKSLSIPEIKLHESQGIEAESGNGIHCSESDTEDVCVGSLGTSHLDSDDSLASDIGLDHMMCQRLFGQKGEVNAYPPINTEGSLAGSHTSSLQRRDLSFTFLENISSGSPADMVDAFGFVHLDKVTANEENGRVSGFMPEVCIDKNDSLQTFQEEGDFMEVAVKLTETRDVGVDAMTQSQSSLSAIFEYFDHSPLEDIEKGNMLSDYLECTKDVQDINSCLYVDRLQINSLEGEGNSEQDPRELEGFENTSDLSGLPENQDTTSQNTNSTGSSEMQTENELQSSDSNLNRAAEADNPVTSYSAFVADLELSSKDQAHAKQVDSTSDTSQQSILETKPKRQAGIECKIPQQSSNDITSVDRKVSDRQGWIQGCPVPRLPPRRPIITNGTLHASLERGVPPPPAFFPSHSRFVESQQANVLQPFSSGSTACFREERQRLFFRRQSSLPQYFHHYDNTRTNRHVPYVNQPIPPLSFSPYCPVSSDRSMVSYIPRPLSDTFTPRSANPFLIQHNQAHIERQRRQGVQQTSSSEDSLSPPPLPPRQPHISRTLDGRPQVHIRPHRIQSDPRPPRPHSFNHYIIDKSKAVASSSSSSSNSSSSPTSSAIPVRPRSHSETQFNIRIQDNQKILNQGQQAKVSGEVSRAVPQRRRLKTRRERSQMKQSKVSSSTDKTITKDPESTNTVTRSSQNTSSLSSKTKSINRSSGVPSEGVHSSQSSRKSSTGSSCVAPSAEHSVCKRGWKDTITSASVCVSGSESSCEDSSGSVN